MKLARLTAHAILGAVLFALLGLGSLTAPGYAADKDDGLISLHGTDKHFQDYMQMIAEQAGVEVLVAENLGGTCGVDFYDLRIEDALDTLVALYDARWYRKDGVIHVVTAEQFQAEHPEEPKADQPDAGQQRDNEDKQDKKRKHESTMDLRVDGLEAGKVFQLLSIQGGINIVRTDQVSDKLTLELKGMTFGQIIDHLLELNGWQKIELDHAMWIATEEEYERWQARQEDEGEGEDKGERDKP